MTESVWSRPQQPLEAHALGAMALNNDVLRAQQQSFINGDLVQAYDHTQEQQKAASTPPVGREKATGLVGGICEYYGTRTGKVCLALTIFFNSLTIAYVGYDHVTEHETVVREAQEHINPQAAELGQQIRMIAQDTKLGTMPREGTYISPTGVRVLRSFAFKDGTLAVIDDKEERRAAKDVSYKEVKNPDGTSRWIPDGFNEPVPTNIDSYKLAYFPSTNNDDDLFSVEVKVDKTTNKVISIDVHEKKEGLEKWYTSAEGESDWYSEQDNISGKKSAVTGQTPQAAKEFMQRAYTFFNSLTDQTD